MLLGWCCCSLVSRVKTFDRLLLFKLLFQFKVSGIVLSVELPSRCYSGPNEHFKAVGQACCNTLTAMAASAWLGVLTSKSDLELSKDRKEINIHNPSVTIGSIMIFITARKVMELAKQPPPVFPASAEAPVMRWMDRNDPFLTIQERRQPNV
jgi:hypothetical protein